MMRSYRAALRAQPLSISKIERVTRGIGRTLSRDFSHEHAWYATNRDSWATFDLETMREEVRRKLDSETGISPMDWVRMDLQYYSDRWNAGRYRRLLLQIEEVKSRV